ncbi:MAG: HupE/UreJ family protein [Chitinophagales bacterium]
MKKILVYCSLFISLVFLSFPSIAHEIRPAYLEINQNTNPSTEYQITWKIPLVGNKAPRITPKFPEGFKLTQTSDNFLSDAYIRYYTGTYDQSLNGQKIGIEGLEMTLVDVLVQINLTNNTSYSLLLQPDEAAATIPIEPSIWEVMKLYIVLGIEHILWGIDHLLFVLCLLLLVQSLTTLIKTITAFTIAHSITLALASIQWVQIPQAPVEAVIALSIVFLAREYLFFREGKADSLTVRYPWLVAFVFGLLHGFGFAGALSEIGFPQQNIPLALLTFNIGVEVGQLLFIVFCINFLNIFQKININSPRWTWKIVPYAIGSLAVFWLIERVIGF